MSNATMEIKSVKRTATLTTAMVTIDGKRFEYISHKGGAWEVYDYPKGWHGVPRFVGYLPEYTGRKFETLIRAH